MQNLVNTPRGVKIGGNAPSGGANVGKKKKKSLLPNRDRKKRDKKQDEGQKGHDLGWHRPLTWARMKRVVCNP